MIFGGCIDIYHTQRPVAASSQLESTDIYIVVAEGGADIADNTRAVDVLDDAAKYDVTSGKGPIGVAAAALYIAAVLEGEKKTQREVADAIGVTEVTIRNRYKEMVETLGIKDEVEERVREEEESVKR